MATPLAPLFGGETLEQYKAKLVKCNTGQLEKKFRKAFPNLTDVQVAAINRQGWIDQLVEQRRAQMALPTPAVAPQVSGGEPTMAQLMKMMMTQQQAFQQQMAADRAAAAEKEEKRIAAEIAEKAAALEREEKRLAAGAAKEERALLTKKLRKLQPLREKRGAGKRKKL